MKILAIETSCDETAISIIEATGGKKHPRFKILSDVVLSQVKLHALYGGVFPNLAKREHSKNLVPVLAQALKEAGLGFKDIDVVKSQMSLDGSFPNVEGHFPNPEFANNYTLSIELAKKTNANKSLLGMLQGFLHGRR